MKHNKNAKRYGAASLELIGGTGGITRMCGTKEFLEVYKIDRTFRIYTPESLDPKETDPNMAGVTKCASEFGSSNKIVARVFIQSHEVIKNIPLKKQINKDNLICIMHQVKEMMLMCNEKYTFVNDQVISTCELIQKGKLENKGNFLTNFPQVDRLDESCSIFLSKSKLVLQKLTELFYEFYGKKFNGPNFNLVYKWATVALKHNSRLIQYLQNIEPITKRIVDLRNAQEHPDGPAGLRIENFQLMPNKVISCPLWYETGKEPVVINEEMRAIITFLLELAESLLITCVMDNIESTFDYRLNIIDEADLDPICPIKYSIVPVLF